MAESSHIKKVNEAKITTKKKALEITEKMEKITEHLNLIKGIDNEVNEKIYEKEKEILVYLYDYYCRFQKLYSDLSFSIILNPIDEDTIKNLDIHNFITEMKKCSKSDYEVTIENLKTDDIPKITAIYEKYNKDLDYLASILIKIQSDIILKDIAPIEQEAMLQSIKNRISISDVFERYQHTDNDYHKFLDEYGATKTIFR